MAKKKHRKPLQFLRSLRKPVNLKKYLDDPKGFVKEFGLSPEDQKALSGSGAPDAVRTLAQDAGSGSFGLLILF